ncbi:hypothetical protein GCM10023083_37650 [Streptomyces phyllanthi]
MAAAAEALAPLLAVSLSDSTLHAVTPASAHREAAKATTPRTERVFIEALDSLGRHPGRARGPGDGELGRGLSPDPRTGSSLLRVVGERIAR